MPRKKFLIWLYIYFLYSQLCHVTARDEDRQPSEEVDLGRKCGSSRKRVFEAQVGRMLDSLVQYCKLLLQR
ncbi:hypothetical protein V1511DRAFT_503832 [Dipodascopsis uninucleata]